MPTRFQKLRKLLSMRPLRYSRSQKLGFVTTNLTLQLQSQLCALPTELIECIAAELELADLCSLRLTCNKLCQRTLHHFGFVYFTTFETNLSRTSLQKLEQISQHPQLGHYVRSLSIKSINNIGEEYSWNRSPSGSLIFPHPGVQTLQDAILNMENCRSFYIYQSNYREGILEADYLEGCDAVAIFLHIIAETSLPVKSFTADFSDWGPREFDASRLHLSTYQKPEFKGAWAYLQELTLQDMPLLQNFDWTVDLFLNASSLRSLSFDCRFEKSNLFFNLASSYDTLPRLQELDLSRGYIKNDSFFKLLFRFRDSLRVLRLSTFILSSTGPSSTGPWDSVFEFLKRELLVLETISVRQLSQFSRKSRELVKFPALSKNPSMSGPAGGRITVTCDLPWRKPSSICGVSYSGPRMGEALGMLIESTEYTSLA